MMQSNGDVFDKRSPARTNISQKLMHYSDVSAFYFNSGIDMEVEGSQNCQR
jgi:hypothetical protein